MSLPPYPGPDGDQGDESKDTPETPPPSEPYGDQPAPPPAYGQQPPAYGYGAYSGANEAGRSWSGTAIAAFVTSLFCCGLPSVILGIIGLLRTGEGKGKGRWMAVTGLVLGVVGIAVQVAAVVGGVWIFSNTVTPDNAEVGECVELDEDDDSVTMWKQDCSDEHDAEIYAVHEVTDAEADGFPTSRDVGALCQGEATGVTTTEGRPLAELIASGELDSYTVYEHEDTQSGDRLACLVRGPGGEDLDEQLLD